MVHFGKFQNGKIVPEDDLRLPEGSRVRIEPIANDPPQADGSTVTDPADTLADFAIDDPSLPTDLAAEHDHYIYGTPKRAQSGNGRKA